MGSFSMPKSEQCVPSYIRPDLFRHAHLLELGPDLHRHRTGHQVQVAGVLTAPVWSGENVQELEPVKGMLKGVVGGARTGDVPSNLTPDRLSICQGGPGAGDPARRLRLRPTWRLAQKVMVATSGTTMYMADGRRPHDQEGEDPNGVESQGMICAEDELGLGEMSCRHQWCWTLSAHWTAAPSTWD
jgi:hypothetical protein